MLTPGDPAPWFTTRSTVNPQFSFDTAAGRYIVICFYGSSVAPVSRRILEDLERNHSRFDVASVVFFGVSTDADDEDQQWVKQEHPGIVHFWDFDHAVSRAFGALPSNGPYQPHTLILDPSLRVVAVIPFRDAAESHFSFILQVLDALPPVRLFAGHAPVLFVPHVFEPDVCRALIELYEQHGGKESGFMREVGGMTVEVADHAHKRRRDCHLTDPQLIQGLQGRLSRRVIPEIKKAFQFNATRIERNVVACYDAADAAHFKPHRDNTTKGTAHRRFAITINLNSEEYEGGNLRFPEYGSATFRAPTGGAIVFSCSLLHEATPVTKGKRYAFLPFLYDDAAAKLRAQNISFLGQQSANVSNDKSSGEAPPG